MRKAWVVTLFTKEEATMQHFADTFPCTPMVGNKIHTLDFVDTLVIHDGVWLRLVDFPRSVSKEKLHELADLIANSPANVKYCDVLKLWRGTN